MLTQAFHKYIDNFRGFSREIWILTLITFINRAGTMVLPFLSKYLKEDLGFSYSQVGWIMVSFGCGSMVGSWLGGKLSDKIGFYKVMIFSLFTSGLMFFGLQHITSYTGLLVAIFLIMVVADMFRPAMFVSLAAYAKPENRTRALSLVRSAINLGFAGGPVLGGLIIMNIGYKGLFWIDGATCIISILIFWFLVKEKDKSKYQNKKDGEVVSKSIQKDKTYLLFLIVTLISGILFFQLFTTMPIYFKKQFNYNEFETGLLLSLNGLLIFFFEIPLINFLHRINANYNKLINYGVFAMSLCFFILIIKSWSGILVIMMIVLIIGEMLAFPFSNSFAMSRALKGEEGKFMAVFTMSYSLAHIISGKLGFYIIEQYGYTANWLFMAFLGLVATYIGYIIHLRVKNEKLKK